jgi:hypothetical protein
MMKYWFGVTLTLASALVSFDSVAQQTATYAFRLAPNPSNVGTCNRLDASMSREHTLTVTGDKAAVKSAGGINDNLKPDGAGVYRTEFRHAGVTLVVVANTAQSPRTLVVTEPRAGCKWNGESR